MRPFLLLSLVVIPVALAEATTPDPRYSTCDAVVVGNASGEAIGQAPAGYDVQIRDVNNTPVPGRVVTLDFSGSSVRLYAAQPAGITLDCAGRRLSMVTDANGKVNFRPQIAGYDNSSAVVVWNGIEELRRVTGRSTDLDAVDGTTGLGDLALFSANFFGNTGAQETDFDASGATGLADFQILAAEFLRFTPPAAYCP